MSGPAGRYDAVVVGAGHNGLVAAAYLARAGRSVLVLERRGEAGGAAASARPFAGVDATLSRYAYLVSLLPPRIVSELGLRFRTLPRSAASCTTSPGGGALLVDRRDAAATRASLEALAGPAEADAWERWERMTAHVAARVFPTLLEPLRSRRELEAEVGDSEAWSALFERPLGEALEQRFAGDLVRGLLMTDGLIGTFASAHDRSLVQNRCHLLHVIGAPWDVPAGGMGVLAAELERAARQAGAEVRTHAEVTSLHPGGRCVEAAWHEDGRDHRVEAGAVLCGAAPAVLARLLGEDPGPPPEGCQLKVNMVLARLPALRDGAVAPERAFAGTFHAGEGLAALEAAHAAAAAGTIPAQVPCELYCHTLTDPSVLGAAERSRGLHAATLFALHLPAGLFRADPEGARAQALRGALASVDALLAEPLESCLARDEHGRPCIEAASPLDLEAELALPAGHIFHRDPSWPFAGDGWAAGSWGVETAHPRILLCGAGAARGGGISGIPGRNAAAALLGGISRPSGTPAS